MEMATVAAGAGCNMLFAHLTLWFFDFLYGIMTSKSKKQFEGQKHMLEGGVCMDMLPKLHDEYTHQQ